MTVKVVGGRWLQNGSTEVSIRAVYAADTVYFLMQYKDETNSIRREPWQKQADGSWKKLADPNDKGGDNNLYHEDKWAMIWNISSPAFEQRGCFSACHTGESKPFGNKYTPNPGDRLDMWHMNGVRTGTVDQVDDQYVSVNAVRYRTSAAGGPRYLCAYEVERTDLPMSKLWNDTSDIGRWKPEVRPYTYNKRYIVGERILSA